jgi:hypothetical protein
MKKMQKKMKMGEQKSMDAKSAAKGPKKPMPKQSKKKMSKKSC